MTILIPTFTFTKLDWVTLKTQCVNENSHVGPTTPMRWDMFETRNTLDIEVKDKKGLRF